MHACSTPTNNTPIGVDSCEEFNIDVYLYNSTRLQDNFQKRNTILQSNTVRNLLRNKLSTNTISIYNTICAKA